MWLEEEGTKIDGWRGLDLAGPIENAVKSADGSLNCNLYLCRGYQYEDNVDNVHAVTAGDVITFHINLVAGHHPGWAVSHLHAQSSHSILDYKDYVFTRLIAITYTRTSRSST